MIVEFWVASPIETETDVMQLLESSVANRGVEVMQVTGAPGFGNVLKRFVNFIDHAVQDGQYMIPAKDKWLIPYIEHGRLIILYRFIQ